MTTFSTDRTTTNQPASRHLTTSSRASDARLRDNEAKPARSAEGAQLSPETFKLTTRDPKSTANHSRQIPTEAESRGRSVADHLPNLVRVAGMQKWNGRIVEIDEPLFSAELTSENDDAVLQADFNLALLGDDAIAEIGDAIYVTVRTVYHQTGYPTQTAAIRLRRLGHWTDADHERFDSLAVAQVEELSDFIE